MKQSVILRAKEIFPGSEIVRKSSFKAISLWDSYALLAKANHKLAMDFVHLWGRSALFEAKDCFECLSPHGVAA